MYKILDLSTGEYVMTYYGSVYGDYICDLPVKEFMYKTYAQRYLHDMVKFYIKKDKRNKNQFEILEVLDV